MNEDCTGVGQFAKDIEMILISLNSREINEANNTECNCEKKAKPVNIIPASDSSLIRKIWNVSNSRTFCAKCLLGQRY